MKRLIYNHPMQGGVSDIFNHTIVAISERLPHAVFKYGVHDAQKWSVPEARYETDRATIYDLVHQPWTINGRLVVLPATFKP